MLEQSVAFKAFVLKHAFGHLFGLAERLVPEEDAGAWAAAYTELTDWLDGLVADAANASAQVREEIEAALQTAEDAAGALVAVLWDRAPDRFADWLDGVIELIGPDGTVEALIARPSDGIGTNADAPGWGATGAELMRLAADARGSNGEMAGAARPGAREISNAVSQQTGETQNAAGASDFLWIWGQFLDHDLSLTEAGTTEQADIAVPTGDPFFDPFGTGTAVIPFTRVEVHDGAYINEITAFIDASMVYGSDAETLAKMRVEGGKLLMTEDAQLELEGANLVTGDVRAAENILLSTMHTLFTREHNRIVDDMAAADPGLLDDVLFEGARARVEAIVQAITYNAFLPVLIGEGAIADYQGYDSSVNPGISVEFSTAVYRLGHTLLSGNLQRLAEDGTALDPLALRDAFFRPSLLREDGMIEDLLRGAASQTAQAVDTMVVEDVRSFLFGPPGAGGFDLAALNIQRGRDLGVASYNDLRTALGLERVESFAAVTSDADLAARLESIYGDVDLIDAWIGGLAEDAVPGGLLGETFSRAMIDQFTRLRDGDAFWSEGREGLSAAEIEALWNTTLSDVILRNTDVEALQSDVFQAMTRIVGTEGRNKLTGTDADDFMAGLDGHDSLAGKRGDDELQGGLGRDRLSGNNGDDILDGGAGNDLLNGGAGSDILTGGAGRDRFVFHARQQGDDVITDFEWGTDRLIVKHGAVTASAIDADSGDLMLTLTGGGTITLEGFADGWIPPIDFLLG